MPNRELLNHMCDYLNLTHKKLIIHVGGSKTGSSFLQKILSSNTLRKCKIGYQWTLDKNINIFPEGGNGQCFYETLNESNVDQCQQKIIELIKDYFREFDISVCSSEFLSELSLEKWQLLITILDSIKVDYKIIVFVRDVVPYFASAYLQSVLYHGVTSSISSWIKNIDKWQHAQVLKNLYIVCEKSKLSVIHFKENEDKLWEKFLVASELNNLIDGSVSQIENKIVNRSINVIEYEEVIEFNKLTNSVFATDIYRLLQKSKSKQHIPSALEKLKNEVSVFCLKFSNDVKWINDTFFNKEERLSLKAEKRKYKITALEEKIERIRIKTILLEYSCLRLSKSNTIFFERITDLIDGLLVDKTQSKSQEIPSDFNPVSYLILNPDLIFNSANPWDHYIRFGIKENRIYKLPRSNY